MAEDDREGWQTLARHLAADLQIVGADIFVTNVDVTRWEYVKRIVRLVKR